MSNKTGIEAIEKEIARLTKHPFLNKKEENKTKAMVTKLREYKLYLEKDPTLDFIESEIGRVTKLISDTTSHKVDFIANTAATRNAEFNRESGVSLLRKQLKNLQSIHNIVTKGTFE